MWKAIITDKHTTIHAIITLKHKTKYINDTRLNVLNIVIESYKLVEYVYVYNET